MTDFKTFKITSQGNSFDDAFRAAKGQALKEDGNTSPILLASTFEDRTSDYRKKDGDEIISKEVDEALVPLCFGAQAKKPIPNLNKIKSAVSNHTSNGARKWYTVYEVHSLSKDGTSLIKEIEPKPNKKEAVDAAREWTGKNMQSSVVKIAKHLEEDSPIVSEITYKQSSRERLGTYVFYGKIPIIGTED